MTDDQRDEYTHTRKEKPVRIRAKKVQAKEKSVLLGMMGGQVLIRHDHFPFDATYTLGREGESEAAREKLDPGMVALMVSKGLLWASSQTGRGDVRYARTDLAQDAAVHNWVIQPATSLPDLFLDE